MASHGYSQRDSHSIPVDSMETQSQSDLKSIVSERSGLSQGRAYSSNDPLSPAKVLRRLGAFEMDTASQSSSVQHSQSQRQHISHVVSRYREDYLAHRSNIDPKARLEEFRQRYQSSRRPVSTPSRVPFTTTTTTTPHDFSFRHRRDWRHNDLEDFDDLLTIKSYSTDTNFSAFNGITQSSLQPQVSQQPPQQQSQQQREQRPYNHDDDMDEFEFRTPARSGTGFSLFDDDDDDDAPAHSWRPPTTALFEQSILKRRRLSHSNVGADINDNTVTRSNNAVISPLHNVVVHDERQQSKEELRHEEIPTQKTRSITSQRSQRRDIDIPNAREQQTMNLSRNMVDDWLQSNHEMDVIEKDNAAVSFLQQQQQQQSTQSSDVKGKGKAMASPLLQKHEQRSAQSRNVNGKDKALSSQQQQQQQQPALSPQREKEPTPIPNMDFEIDFDDMDLGGDDYNQQPDLSPSSLQPTSDVEHGQHAASSSRDNAPSQDNTRVSEQRHQDPEALLQVHPEGRYGNQLLAAVDQEIRTQGKPTSIRRIQQLRKLGKIMFGKSAIRMDKEAEERLGVISDTFYKQATNDLAVYAQHAKRRTIKKEDVIMLLRRQERLTDNTSIEELAHKYLPRELWDEICVSALAYNELYPKKRNNIL